MPLRIVPASLKLAKACMLHPSGEHLRGDITEQATNLLRQCQPRNRRARDLIEIPLAHLMRRLQDDLPLTCVVPGTPCWQSWLLKVRPWPRITACLNEMAER